MLFSSQYNDCAGRSLWLCVASVPLWEPLKSKLSLLRKTGRQWSTNALVQHLRQTVRPVGDDAVHAPVQQPIHVRDLVHRPYMDLKAFVVKLPHEPRRDTLHVSNLLTRLHDVRRHAGRKTEPQLVQHEKWHRVLAARTDAPLVLAEPGPQRPVLARRYHAVGIAGPPDCFEQWLLRRRDLHFHRKSHFGQRREYFVDSGNPRTLPAPGEGAPAVHCEAIARVERLQLRECHPGNVPRAVRCAVYGLIMDDNAMAIRAGPHVQLDHVGAPLL